MLFALACDHQDGAVRQTTCPREMKLPTLGRFRDEEIGLQRVSR